MQNATESNAYGLWGLAFINAAVFIMFAFSFFKPKTTRDWRTFSTFSAFIVALFAEMYGFPLTIYLASGWLQSRFLGTDFLSHDAGHIWYSLLGFKGDPHLNPMFPVLVTMYVRLAHGEEREVATEFGQVWEAYAATTPRWFPRLGGVAGAGTRHAEGRS